MTERNPFMARAIELSMENVVCGGGPFGAVVVKEGRLIAEAANRVVKASDPTAHAEILAIREACRKLGAFHLNGCEIYASCEPCPMCLGAIYWAHLSRIYFANLNSDASAIGFDDSEIYRELSRQNSQRRIPMVQMMREEALTAFEAWEKKADKIGY